MSEYLDVLARNAGYDSYELYLLSKHWKNCLKLFRASKCWCCGNKGRLCLHHLVYDRLGCELPQDIITVCNVCHERIHLLVKSRVTSLQEAHIVVSKKRMKKKKKRWVTNWRQLTDRHETKYYERLKFLLRDNDLIDGNLPTEKAFRWKFVRVAKGRVLWSVGKWKRLLDNHKKAIKKDAKLEKPAN